MTDLHNPSCGFLGRVQVSLEADKHLPYPGIADAQLCDGIVDCAVLQVQQIGQFPVVQFADSLFDVVVKNEI